MPGTTPIYSLPYPVSSDLVSAYPALGQDLAEDLDDILAAKLGTLSVNAQTGTTYTLTTSDPQKVITMTNAAASSVTIPTNATAAIAIGSSIEIVNLSTGVNTTVSAAGGVTFNGGPVVLSPGSSVTLVKIGTDAWMAQGQGSPGLVHVASSTFSAVSSVSVNNCFTATYSHYMLAIELETSAATNIRLRLRASGSDDSNSNYQFGGTRTDTAATVNGVGGAGETYMGLISATAATATASAGGTFTVMRPQMAARTLFSGVATGYAGGVSRFTAETAGGQFNNTTQFDGFTLYPGSGTISGTIRVFGYRN